MAAVPCLGLCGWVVLRDWGREEEEEGEEGTAMMMKKKKGAQGSSVSSSSTTAAPLSAPMRARFSRSCLEGLRCLLSDRRVLLLGGLQAAFESVLYIFVFLWTPVLDPHDPPLGIVFSCLMAASMAGSSLYRLASSSRYRLQPVHLLCLAALLAFFALFMLVFSTAPGQPRPHESFLAFLLLELACGLYFPAVSFLQSRVIPQERRAGVLAWFRLPLHLLACLGLLALHGEVSAPGGEGEGGGGTRHMFTGCAGMMLAALLAGVSLFTLGRHDPQLRLEVSGGPESGEEGRGEGEH
ncbi:MFSD5 protein, partial [Amia calva]|nr:MFSD5 protein [Amia calva]